MITKQLITTMAVLLTISEVHAHATRFLAKRLVPLFIQTESFNAGTPILFANRPTRGKRGTPETIFPQPDSRPYDERRKPQENYTPEGEEDLSIIRDYNNSDSRKKEMIAERIQYLIMIGEKSTGTPERIVPHPDSIPHEREKFPIDRGRDYNPNTDQSYLEDLPIRDNNRYDRYVEVAEQ